MPGIIPRKSWESKSTRSEVMCFRTFGTGASAADGAREGPDDAAAGAEGDEEAGGAVGTPAAAMATRGETAASARPPSGRGHP